MGSTIKSSEWHAPLIGTLECRAPESVLQVTRAACRAFLRVAHVSTAGTDGAVGCYAAGWSFPVDVWVWSYACATRCPVLTWAIAYACAMGCPAIGCVLLELISGRYHPLSPYPYPPNRLPATVLRHVLYGPTSVSGTVLLTCYAMSGTVLRACYAMSAIAGTDGANRGTRVVFAGTTTEEGLLMLM
eukprot:3935442-Rhodomonas_salina.1